MALYSFPSNEDLESFAETFLGLDKSDTCLFYESYYNLNSDDYEEEIQENEVTQEVWQY